MQKRMHQLHKFLLKSNLVNPVLLLSGRLIFGQNFHTPEFCIIPIQLEKIHRNPKKVNPEFGPNPD